MRPLPPVVFDLDGTLIDSVPDLMAAVNRMLTDEGLPEMARAEVQSYVGDGAPVLVGRVMAARGLPEARHQELTERIVADYTDHSAEATKVYPNVRAALNTLAHTGHALGICTNKPIGATRAVLEALGLSDIFSVVIGGDSLPECKPNPTPLHAAFAAIGGPGLYVGDSEVDARTALAAELPFLLYTEGYLRVPISQIRVTQAFSDFAELPEIVARF